VSSSWLKRRNESFASQDGADHVALAKEERLRHLFREMGSALVLLWRVDSTYLAYVANSELGGNALASLENRRVCRAGSASRRFVWPTVRLSQGSSQADELEDVNYTANGPTLVTVAGRHTRSLKSLSRVREIEFIVDGSTCDDLTDFRP